MEFEWDIANFLKTENINGNYAVLVLNRPILNDKNLIFNLWKNGKRRVLKSRSEIQIFLKF